MDFLLVVQIAAERVELRRPEFLVMGQPHGGLLHRFRRELAAHHTAFLRTRDEPRFLQHAQVLHEPGQRHAVRFRQLRHGRAALLQAPQDVAPRRIRQGPEHLVEDRSVPRHARDRRLKRRPPWVRAAAC
jgi:hypothetical protein